MQNDASAPNRRFVRYSITDPSVWLTLSIVVIGIGIFGSGASDQCQRQSFLANSIAAVGTVTGMTYTYSGHRGHSYTRPQVRFSPINSTESISFSSSYSSDADYEEGDAVRIRYLRSNPRKAEVESMLHSANYAVTLMLIGAFLTFSGAGLTYRMLHGFESNR